MFAKISKKVVAVTLVAALAFSVGVVDNAKKSDAKLKKSAKVSQGKEVKLTASGKAKWSTSNDQIAHPQKESGKSVKILGIKAGKATITAAVGSKKETCKVTVTKAPKGFVIYDFAKSTDPENCPPYKGNYSEFKYNSFRIWLCNATFFGEKNYISPDYRGRKLKVKITVKNSGKRDLPELGVCFNYTNPGNGQKEGYPFALHVSEKKLAAKVKKDTQHRRTKFVTQKIKKGKTYTWTFTFTIPKKALNTDKDSDTGAYYPIMMYIPNCKDSSPYKPGDEVTVKACKITCA